LLVLAVAVSQVTTAVEVVALVGCCNTQGRQLPPELT
jgi:hypothetical protein